MSRWRRIHDAFEHALALADGKREAFLSETGTTDPELAGMVRQLLNADRAAESLSSGSLSSPEVPATEHPARVGPYRVLRPIGQGGMSTVYLARRDDAFKRQAALKVIRRGMEGEAAERRLRSEREILAHLDHPSIARLYDGGTTEEGQPYFLMELIEGTKVDAYCDQEQLTIASRLDLFSKILDAVHYAHQNLVVHRDLKPSNILVTPDGNPKLLDFGISTVLNAKMAAGGDPGAEESETRALTPGYASPEQMRGDPVTTSSDIYSLGVLLYKLLTGSHPASSRDDSSAARPLLPPSAAVAGLDDESAEAVARARRTRPAALVSRLRGDLDAIVMKALEPAAKRRYGSVEALAQDLRRHRDGLPVSAVPDAFAYRMVKRLRRRAGTIVAAGLATILLAGLVGSLAVQSRRLEAERDRVRMQRDEVSRVLSFTERILGHADPTITGGRDWTVREALRHGDSLIEKELSSSPEIRSRLHGTVGRIFLGLGDTDTAIEHLTETRDLARERAGASSVAYAAALSDLATAWVAAGEYDRAEASASEAVSLFRSHADLESHGGVTALNAYVTALCAEGDFQTADAASFEALTLARSVPEIADPALERAMHNRARVLNQRGETEAASRLYREVLDRRQARLVAPHPDIASTQVNLGMTLERLDRHEEAKGLLELALGQQRAVFGERDPRLAATLNNLAVLYLALDQPARAEDAYRRAVALFADDNVQRLRIRIELAALLDRTGRGRDAEALLRREIEHWRTKLRPGNTLIAWAENTLGSVLTEQGRYEEADVLLTRSVPLIRERRGPDDAYTRKAESRLARWRELANPEGRTGGSSSD